MIGRICKTCGIAFVAPEYRVLAGKANYCSRTCAYKLQQGTLVERFWRNIKKDPNSDCWIWLGCTDEDGYGLLGENYLTKRANRVSWELHNGPITNDLWVLHTCDVPSCTNPAHLYLGTHADNVKDRIDRKRQIPQKGEENVCSKLTDNDIKIIRDRYNCGKFTQRQIALEFGVTQSTVYKIIKHQRWQHVI